MLSRALFWKLVRFGVVGLGVMVIFAGLNALFGVLGMGKFAAYCLAYPLALLVHFLANKYWTFEQKEKVRGKQVAEYVIMVVVTALVQAGIFAYISGRWPMLPGWLDAMLSSASQMILSFAFMQTRVFAKAKPKDRPAVHARAYESVVTGILVAGVIVLYAWIISPTLEGWKHPSHVADYYNAEVHGLVKGHLYMDVKMPKDLPPYQVGVLPKGAPFLLDASYYRHHYYLYFGIAPLLTFFLPYFLATGNELAPQWVVLIQASLGFVALVGALSLLRKKYFPHASTLMWALAIVALGLTTGMPATIRRSLLYEVSTTASFLYGMGLLWSLLKADESARPKGWLALASLCGGLAFASRPNVGFGAAAVLPFAAYWFSRRRTGPSVLWYLVCGVPAALCLGVVLAFNAARFGSPLDFGHAYQMGSDARTFLSLRYVWQNLKVYYLLPPTLSWYFPFVAPGLEGLKPEGYIGLEEASGQWLFVPFVIAAVIAWWSVRPRPLGDSLRLFLWAAALWFGVNFAVLCTVSARANRYLLDCHPALAALACVGLLAVSGRSGSRRWLSVLAGAWVVLCGAHNLLESFETESFFANLNPELNTALASRLNRFAAPVQALFGRSPGTQAFDVTFQTGVPGRIDPLLFSGWPNHADSLQVWYSDASTAQMWYVHNPDGKITGRSFHFTPGTTCRMVVQAGTFFPPLGHPWYGTMPVWEQVYLRSHVKVTVGGETVLEGDCPSYEGGPDFRYLGRRGDLELCEERFLGTLVPAGAVGVDRAALDAHANTHGSQQLTVRLPRDRFGVREPLICAGISHNYNLVGVKYTDPEHLQFFFQEAGAENAYSDPIPVDYLQDQTVEARFVGLDRERDGPDLVLEPVEVWLNGKRVFAIRHLQCSAPSGAVFLGGKPWADGGIRSMFGGEIISSRRIASADAALETFRRTGIFEATLVLPQENTRQSEPLLVLGKTGEADGLFVQYLGPDSLRFGLDRWNQSLDTSKPVQVDPSVKHAFKAAYGPLLPKGREGSRDWTVWLDGAKVFVVHGVDGPARTPAALGRNEIGMSTSQAAFSGCFEGAFSP